MVLARWGRSAGIVFALVALAIVALWFVGGATASPSLRSDSFPDGSCYTAFYADTDAEAARIRKKLTDAGYQVTDSFSTGVAAVHTIIILKPYTQADYLAAGYKLSKQIGDKRWYCSTLQDHFFLRDLQQGKYSFGRFFVTGYLSTSQSRALLSVLALSAGAAGLLALLLLVRGIPAPTILWLGLGLGAWALGISYMWLYSIAPSFAAYQPTLIWPKLLLDVAAMLLILLASHAYIRFWKGFPQPVSDVELDRFLARQKAEQLAKAGIGSGAEEVVTVAAPVWWRRIWPGLIVLVTVCTGLSWTGLGVTLLTHPFAAVPAFLLDISIYILLIYWPGITCLRVYRYHLALGSPEDCRKIEWIRASIWLGFMAAVLPLCIEALISVVDHFSDVFVDFEDLASSLVMFGLSAGPLFVIIAVAISIFYKGNIDPRLALRQVTLWSVVGVMLTLGFVLVERSVAVKVAQWAHLSPQTGYVTAGAVVAATFQPIRKRVEIYVNRFVERALPRDRSAEGARGTQAVVREDNSGYPGLVGKGDQSGRSG